MKNAYVRLRNKFQVSVQKLAFMFCSVFYLWTTSRDRTYVSQSKYNLIPRPHCIFHSWTNEWHAAQVLNNSRFHFHSRSRSPRRRPSLDDDCGHFFRMSRPWCLLAWSESVSQRIRISLVVLCFNAMANNSAIGLQLICMALGSYLSLLRYKFKRVRW